MSPLAMRALLTSTVVLHRNAVLPPSTCAVHSYKGTRTTLSATCVTGYISTHTRVKPTLNSTSRSWIEPKHCTCQTWAASVSHWVNDDTFRAYTTDLHAQMVWWSDCLCPVAGLHAYTSVSCGAACQHYTTHQSVWCSELAGVCLLHFERQWRITEEIWRSRGIRTELPGWCRHQDIDGLLLYTLNLYRTYTSVMKEIYIYSAL